jgi:formylglycine-generating enzyme required for sulfatase activity
LRAPHFRKSAALQLGILAAVGGALCGTALAYLLSPGHDGKTSIEQPLAEVTTDEGPIPNDDPPKAVPPPEDTAELASLDAPPTVEPAGGASTGGAASSSEDDTDRGAVELLTPPDSAASENEVDAQASKVQSAALAQPDDPETAPSSAIAAPGGLETFRDCARCPLMVKVPSSQFTMGSPLNEDGRQEYEGPQRLVNVVKPFAIGQFEITFDQWNACVKEGGCQERPKDEGWGQGARPAIHISWEAITKEYLPWLSHKTGHRYRLPSEAEWEYAARGNGRDRFSFGSNSNDICSFGNGADQTAKEQSGAGAATSCRDGFANTAPVGSFRPNQFGLFDMHGNVWEWVEDCWNENYDSAPSNGSAWTSGDCSSRVVRGGSWNSDVNKLRSAARGWNDPGGRNRSIGFRVARDL